jgi:hypothetical protein
MHPISIFMLAAASCIAIAQSCAAESTAQPPVPGTILSDPNTSMSASASCNSIDDAGIVAGSYYSLTDNATHASV